MDKSWMHADRRSRKFELGLAEFLKFASANARNERKIRCPCLKCCNTDGFSIGVIKDHIFWNGIDESYKNWRWHGEPSTSYVNSRMGGESETVDWELASGVGENDVDIGESEDEEISEDSNEFLKYVEDGDKPLYPGCTKTTKRSVVSKSKKAKVYLKSASGSKHGRSKKPGSKHGRSKKPDNDDENVTGGLKLLKRGMVTMNRISKRLISGRRMKVECNAQGEPIGKAAKEMQSYIGVLARTKIPISIQDWREVDVDEKDKIWESIEDAFVVPKEWKKLVLTSAANKWREFKSKLTKLYIIPYLETPELLQFPPDDYRSIEQEDWDTFVADRTSHTFQELRHAQILKRKENKYPHRMSRKGYANLQEELSESTPIEELDRATMWIKARQDKTGSFNGPAIEKAVEKIEIFKKKVSDGEITTYGSDDVLTLALGSPEYPGRVRGVGGFVKPNSYFNLPKRRKQSVEELVRISVKKILAEERQSIIAEEKAKWDFEREQQIERERAMWEERLRKLESKVEGKEVLVESLKPVTAVNELDYATGSYSRQIEQALKVSEAEATKNVKLLDLAEVAEKLSKDKVIIDSNASKKLTSIIQDKSVNVKSEFKLSIGSVDNIVAFGTIVEVDVEATQQTIHGVPLGEENVRISITKAVVANALLPFPIKDEIVRVADAIGTCVAWPKSLVIPSEVVEKEQENRKIVKRKRRDMYEDFDHDDLDNLPPKLPLPLKELCQWANIFLKNGVTIHTTLGEEIFGRPRKVAIFRRDVYAMTHMKEISNSTIVMYMSCLYQKLQKSKMLHMIAFIDPAKTGVLGCGNPTERARSLSACYAKGKSGQIFLVPYNSGCYWMLTVVNPAEEVVHFMDPSKRRLITGEWKTIVDNSIKIYNAQKHKKGRKTVTWKNCAGIPEQQGDKTCGFWIMHYMKDIVEDKNQEWSAKWDRKASNMYTQNDIDEVRAEWAQYVAQFKES
ncbi:uncharacterized protein LOC133731647 isoform X2 [Rosa rugosa]|uniref:uncharacterized protein LOC133731647 isoform X2 n=1 Tax=Rosa rugosa TaxID=74645 RepID=UPI002B4115E0|nr:uncharacterized protein LOC133731647 isoform X2 [Rosa rugosa]